MGQLILKILQYSNILHTLILMKVRALHCFIQCFPKMNRVLWPTGAARRRVGPDPGDDVANITGVHYIIHVLLIQYHHLN